MTIRKEFSKKLGEPYNRCLEDTKSVDSFDSSLFREILNQNLTYSQKDCLNYLALKEIATKCDCETELSKLLEFCVVKNISCLASIYTTYFKDNPHEELAKKCPLECLTIDFRILTTFSDIFYQELIGDINSNSLFKSNYENIKIDYETLKKTVLSVMIYYEDHSYTMISQTAKTGFLDLVSNFGGLLGLFIGTSFLSFVELIEIFIEIRFILFESKKERNRNLVKN